MVTKVTTIPKRWVQVTIGESLNLINGKAFKPSDWHNSGLPIIRIQNLNNASKPFNYYSGKIEDKYIINKDDLLFAWSGTPGTSFGAHIWKNGKAVLNQHIFKVEFDETAFDKHFLLHFLNHNVQQYIAQAHGTAGLAHITKKTFESAHLFFPPINEQERISDKIEQLFTQLDTGVESLKKAKLLLKRYRQSVLKAAMEGRLTAKWREKNKDKLEPASELLKRILKERREKWEAEQLAKFKAKGKLPKNDDWKKKYKEPTPPNTSNLPKLPEGWVWAKCEQILSKVTDGTHHTPTYVAAGIPFLSVKDIRDGKLFFENCKFISEKEHKRLFARCNPECGDVLITKSGTIGRTAVIRTTEQFSLFVSVALLKKVSNLLDSDYLKIACDYYIQSINIQQVVKGGVIKNLHLEDIRQVPLVLPSLSEQQSIIQEFANRLSIVDKLEQELDSVNIQSGALKRSILLSAFQGKLVSQNESDEPASKLLERIANK